jgi:cytochrome c peroxidase
MSCRKLSGFIVLGLIVLGGLCLSMRSIGASDDLEPQLSPLEELGGFLYFDANLSNPPGQACAACHAPEAGFTGPDSKINAGQAVYPGAVHTRAGNRKPPTAAYAGDSPVLYFDEIEGLWIGGMFWDGRATGWTLGDPLAEQALGPFLNDLEQNLPQARLVIKRVAGSKYAKLFEQVWGPGSLDFVKDVKGTYERIGRSIAAFERSGMVNPFTSKFDYYLKGQATLTAREKAGLELFEGKALCSACHLSDGDRPLFTDFTFDNLGVPKNPDNPFYKLPRYWNPDGEGWVDLGLGGFLMNVVDDPEVAIAELGKHKVPTLRNVDRRPQADFVKAYGHNGYFKSLEEIVHFYNTRDVEDWPAPEVPINVNDSELGDLGLTADEEAAIVAFLRTLSDGYTFP